jgi:hypothetical protein
MILEIVSTERDFSFCFQGLVQRRTLRFAWRATAFAQNSPRFLLAKRQRL